MNEIGPLTNSLVGPPCKHNRVVYHLASFLAVPALLFFLISCQEDNALKKVCTDPIGSEDVTMQNNTQFCPREEQNGCFRTQLGATTQIFQAINYSGKLLGMIVDVGAIACLGEIIVKPSTGYVYSANIVVKHGYIIKLPDGTFCRLFVDSVAKSSAGAVTKIFVTWQYSF